MMQVGDAKDNVRKDVRGIIKILYKLYPVSKMFTFLMDGIKSKNAKQRMGKDRFLFNTVCLIHIYSVSLIRILPDVQFILVFFLEIFTILKYRRVTNLTYDIE